MVSSDRMRVRVLPVTNGLLDEVVDGEGDGGGDGVLEEIEGDAAEHAPDALGAEDESQGPHHARPADAGRAAEGLLAAADRVEGVDEEL